LVGYQPEYWLVKKWKHVLLNSRAHVRRRKQAIVAFARQLFIDLWKWKTGRATAESLGWKLTAKNAEIARWVKDTLFQYPAKSSQIAKILRTDPPPSS